MILFLLSGLVATPVNFDPLDGYQNVSPGFINAPKSLYVPDVGILSFPWSGVGPDDEAFSLHRVLQGLLDSANGNAGFTDPDAFFAALWQTQCEDPLDADPRTNCEPQDQNGFPTHCADQGFCDLVQDTTPSDFKPYALINRFDLMNEKSCGQARIIFQRKTLFDGTVDDQEIDKLPLVIFEMNVPNPSAGSACPIDDGCRAWAERWAELSELDRDQRRAALMEMYFDGYGPYQPVIQWSAVREGVGAVRIFGDQNHFTTESEKWNNDIYRVLDACNPPQVAGDVCNVKATADGPLGGLIQSGTCQPLPATGRLSCVLPIPVPDLPLGFFQVNLSIVGLLGPVDDPPNRPSKGAGNTDGKLSADDDESFAALVGQKSEGATGAGAAKMTLTSSAPHLAWHKGLLASAPHPELFANDSTFFDWFLQRGVPVLARATHITHMDLPGAGTTAYPTPGVANTQDGIMYGVTDTQTYAGFGQVDAPHQTHVNLNAPYAGTFTSAPTLRAALQNRLTALGYGPRITPDNLMFRMNMASCVGCHDFAHGANPAKAAAGLGHADYKDLGRAPTATGYHAWPETAQVGFWFYEGSDRFNPPTPCNETAGGPTGLCNLPSFAGPVIGPQVCGATEVNPGPGQFHLDWSTAHPFGSPGWNRCQENRSPHPFLKYRGVLLSKFLTATQPVCTATQANNLGHAVGLSLIQLEKLGDDGGGNGG